MNEEKGRSPEQWSKSSNSTLTRLLSPKDTMIIAFLGETFKTYRESSLFFLECLVLTCPLCLGSTNSLSGSNAINVPRPMPYYRICYHHTNITPSRSRPFIISFPYKCRTLLKFKFNILLCFQVLLALIILKRCRGKPQLPCYLNIHYGL